MLCHSSAAKWNSGLWLWLIKDYSVVLLLSYGNDWDLVSLAIEAIEATAVWIILPSGWDLHIIAGR